MQLLYKFFYACKLLSVEHFYLQSSKETFHRAVIHTVALARHIKEKNVFIKKFIEKNIIQGKTNTSVFANEPLDKSTYYAYKNKFVDILYHCCIREGLVTLQEILEEDIVKDSFE